MKRYQIVNRLIKQLKPKDITGRVSKHDIIDFIGPYCLILQRKQDCNNLAMFRINACYSVSALPIALSFIRKCYFMYNIDFVRVRGSQGRYRAISRRFEGVSDETGETYYFDLKKVVKICSQKQINSN